MGYIIKNKSGKFFAGHEVAEQGHIDAEWVDDRHDNRVQVFARKDVAQNAAEFFGGEVMADD